jgi:DNA polymerase-3 subunit epsilon
MTRQIILDTETTGLEHNLGHRIIEVGCVELRSRRASGNNFWTYINPEREIDAAAQEVHGISLQFLADKPKFADIAEKLWKYLDGAELIIHNASFDIGFLNAEFARLGRGRIDEACKVTDTLLMARQMHPGQKASLDALCKRYSVDNSGRNLHGALLDAQLLAEVYLAMTGGQSTLGLDAGPGAAKAGAVTQEEDSMASVLPLHVIRADEEELKVHRDRLKTVLKKSGKCYWADDLPTAH